MLKVTRGQFQAGACAPSAGLLELAGADGILFEDDGDADRAWIRTVAASVFIPFAVTCGTGEDADLEAILEAGADAGVVTVTPADLPGLTTLAQRFGCAGLWLSVALDWTPEAGWTAPDGGNGLAWLAQLGEGGAGELLLTLTDDHLAGLEALGQGLARLPMPVLVRTGSWEVGLEALLHGADGLIYPAELGSPAACKAYLAHSSLTFR